VTSTNIECLPNLDNTCAYIYQDFNACIIVCFDNGFLTCCTIKLYPVSGGISLRLNDIIRRTYLR